MKRKVYYGILILIIIIVITGGILFKKNILSAEDSMSNLINKTLNIDKNSSNDVVSTVEGQPIYKKDLEIAELFDKTRVENQNKFIELNSEVKISPARQKTRKELLDELIERKAIMEVAKKEGYIVTKKEAENYYNNIQNTINDILNGKIKGNVEDAKKAKELLDLYKSNLSEDEFKEKIIGAYQEILTISKYFKAKTDEYIKSHPNATNDEINQFVDSLKKNIKSSTRIEVKDPELQ
ncbi:hypothetical protein ACAG39_06855 [Caldicellulosiruptoraceae bacterium PP1]